MFGIRNSHQNANNKFVSCKTLVVVIALCMVVFSCVGGTIAWLMAQTDPVTNVFTCGDINITLEETTGDEYKMTPGKVLSKDPKVTVLADSEDCWLFVKVEESTNVKLSDYITYSVADGWISLDGSAGVYYREVDRNADSKQTFDILANNQVIVKESVTKSMLDGLTDANYPTLTCTAYAVQRDAEIDAIDTAAEAWALIGNN